MTRSRSGESPQSPQSPPSVNFNPFNRHSPIPIPDNGKKTALSNGATISPMQVHRRLSVPQNWSSSTSPPNFIESGRRLSMSGALPTTNQMRDSIDRRSFAVAPESTNVSHDDSNYVLCNHHHHRRPSIAMRFFPSPNEQQGESTQTRERVNRQHTRQPSPTGERLLKGEVAF